jgi:EPS-associated MarR family transcriptional regulator
MNALDFGRLYRGCVFCTPCGSLPANFLKCLFSMINDELEYRVLKWLQNNPNITQRKLASELGVSLGKVNFLLKSLTQVGWVKLENFKRSDNKIGYAYLLTPAGLSEMARIARSYLERKEVEYQQLENEIQQLRSEVKKF